MNSVQPSSMPVHSSPTKSRQENQLTHPSSLPELIGLTVEAFRIPLPTRLIVKGNAPNLLRIYVIRQFLRLNCSPEYCFFVWWRHALVLHFFFLFIRSTFSFCSNNCFFYGLFVKIAEDSLFLLYTRP